MEKLTEPYEANYFRIRGNKTVYNRNPKKSSHVAFALAKLFQIEWMDELKNCPYCEGVVEHIDEFEGYKGLYYFCPVCGKKITERN